MAQKKIIMTDKKLKQLSKQLPTKLGTLIVHGHHSIQAMISLHEVAELKIPNTLTFADLPIRSSINVRYVSFIESFLKQSYADLIDINRFSFQGKIELDFKSLVELRNNPSKLTNGQIVARELNF